MRMSNQQRFYVLLKNSRDCWNEHEKGCIPTRRPLATRQDHILGPESGAESRNGVLLTSPSNFSEPGL